MRGKPKAGVRAGLCLVFCAIACAAFAALTFPALTGRVVDEAGILNAATRDALTAKLAALEAKTADQLVVVTLKSLQGTSIEDFGVQLGRAWKIGQKEKNNGVVLIVAPNERKVRIEVGYGLEGTLTDAITRLIIENSIIPRFRANDFAGGVARGVDDIIGALTDNEDWKRRAQPLTVPSPSTADGWMWLVFVLFFGVVVFVVLVIMRDIVREPAKPQRRSDGWTFGPSAWAAGAGGFSGSGGGGSSGGGFSGGGGSFGGGGSSGSW